MSCNRPVITTNCSGHPIGFANGTHGLVVDKDNVQELANALVSFSNKSTTELQSMGDNAVELCHNVYDIKKTGRHFVNIVERAIESKDYDFRTFEKAIAGDCENAC